MFVPAPVVSMAFLIETVLAPVWVWLIFGERPVDLAMAGGGVVIATLVAHSVAELRPAGAAVGASATSGAYDAGERGASGEASASPRSWDGPRDGRYPPGTGLSGELVGLREALRHQATGLSPVTAPFEKLGLGPREQPAGG